MIFMNKNNMNTTNNSNTDKSMDDLLNNAFNSMEPWELDDSTLNSYLAASGATTGSKVRRVAKRFTATAACLAVILVGGFLIKDKLADSNNSSGDGSSTPATTVDDNTDANTDNEENKNNITYTDEYISKFDDQYNKFMEGKMKLIVMDGVCTELGIVGYQCIVASDCEAARQGQVVTLTFNDAVDEFIGTIPDFMLIDGQATTQRMKPGDVIAVEDPKAVDTMYPAPIYVNDASSVYIISGALTFPTPSTFTYAPTNFEHLPSSVMALTGVNTYVNEDQLYRLLEAVNSEEGTPFALTIASKDYSWLSADYINKQMSTEQAHLYSTCKFLLDNNYGITTYYDILYSGGYFVVRCDDTEKNVIPERNLVSTPFVTTYHNLHVVEDYKGTGSKCIYLCNDATPMSPEELVLFLEKYNNPVDTEGTRENYFVVMQSHLGVKGLRGGVDDNSDDEIDKENNPVNVNTEWVDGLGFIDNTNGELKENLLAEDAYIDQIISVEEAITTAKNLQGAVILPKNVEKIILHDISLGHTYDIGSDLIKGSWNSTIIYKINATCVGTDYSGTDYSYDTVFYVNAIKSEVKDSNEDKLDFGVTLPPDHSEYRSEDELIKAINSGNKEELKDLTLFYMAGYVPKNWYIDKILVTPDSITTTYKYVKDNEVKNVGDYSFTWIRTPQTGQDESTYTIITWENGVKFVKWYENGNCFSAKVPLDAGIDEIRGVANTSSVIPR